MPLKNCIKVLSDRRMKNQRICVTKASLPLFSIPYAFLGNSFYSCVQFSSPWSISYACDNRADVLEAVARRFSLTLRGWKLFQVARVISLDIINMYRGLSFFYKYAEHLEFHRSYNVSKCY